MRIAAKPELCAVVLDAIASVDGVHPSDLEFTLHEHVNTEALNLLDESEQGPWALSFETPGHEVTVQSDRTVIVDGEPVRENA